MLVSGNAILYSGDNGKRRTAGCPRLPSLRGGAGPQKARQGQFHGDKEEKGDTFEEGTHLNPLRGPMHGTADGGAGSSRERDTKRAGAGHGDCGRAGRWRRHARDESGRGRPADRQSAGSLGRLEQGLHSGDHRGPRRHPEIRLQSGGAHRRRRGGPYANPVRARPGHLCAQRLEQSAECYPRRGHRVFFLLPGGLRRVHGRHGPVVLHRVFPGHPRLGVPGHLLYPAKARQKHERLRVPAQPDLRYRLV